MPPRAFQNRKGGHDIRVAPAIHAAVMRSPVTQRPRNTALGPWRSKNGSPTPATAPRGWGKGAGADKERLATLENGPRVMQERPWCGEHPPAEPAPDGEADVVAQDRRDG